MNLLSGSWVRQIERRTPGRGQHTPSGMALSIGYGFALFNRRQHYFLASSLSLRKSAKAWARYFGFTMSTPILVLATVSCYAYSVGFSSIASPCSFLSVSSCLQSLPISPSTRLPCVLLLILQWLLFFFISASRPRLTVSSSTVARDYNTGSFSKSQRILVTFSLKQSRL